MISIKLSVVGIGMKSRVGIASRFFKVLENIDKARYNFRNKNLMLDEKYNLSKQKIF